MRRTCTFHFASKEPILAEVILLMCIYTPLAYELPLNRGEPTQSSTHPGYPAKAATDGVVAVSTSIAGCAHTKNDAKAWWKIRMDKTYVVRSVTIYNTFGAPNRMQRLNITVGTDPELGKQSLCEYYFPSVPAGGSATIMCTRELTGSYIGIQKTSSTTYDATGSVETNNDGYLTLCEVEASGYEVCSGKFFGPGCRTACNCQKKCDDENGTCHGGVCVAGYTGAKCQQEVICTKPQEIAQATFTELVTYKYGSTVTYKCFTGYYVVSGNQRRTCGVDGSWNGTDIECRRVSCGDPGDVANGIKSGRSYLYTNIVTYSCFTGYEINGDAKLTCTWKKTWSGTKPTCKRVSCGNPGHVEHSTVSGSSYLYGDKVTYTCLSGYEIKSGHSERTCESSTNWSGQQPTCGKISCGDPGDIENANKNGNSYRYGDQVTYTCVDGYEKRSGDGMRTCESSKTWSGTKLTCRKMSCGDPGIVEHANKRGSSYRFNDKVIYSCDTGYEIITGNTVRVCVFSSSLVRWSGSPPRCGKISCGEPGKIDHGQRTGNSYFYEDKVVYTCSEGYAITTGDAERTCQADKKWSGKEPKCGKVYCPDPGIVAFAIRSDTTFKFGDTVTYKCKPGYEIKLGNSKRMCQANKKWNGTSPTCGKISCGDPGSPQHTTKRGVSHMYADSVTYNCVDGYERLTGDVNRKCGENKQWSGSPLKCKKVSCGDPGNVTMATKRGNYLYLDKVIYTCYNGYSLKIGDLQRTCTSSKSWTGVAPICAATASRGSRNTGLIAGITLAALGLIAAIVVGAIFNIRLQRRMNANKPYETAIESKMTKSSSDSKNGKKPTNLTIEMKQKDSPHVGAEKPVIAVKPMVSGKRQTPYKERPNIPVKQLEEHVEKMHNGENFEKEFAEIKSGITAPCLMADKPQNKVKNRFQNIKAYDHSRVVLDLLDGDPHSDYINACYIDGYKAPMAYVALQGPNSATINDIWRMIWQLKSNRLVMVTNLVESGKKKCEQYWPESGFLQYDQIGVTLLRTEKFADFDIRTFSLTSGDGNTQTVRQFHYTAWPDKDVPQFATSLLAFHKKICSFDKTSRGPLIVHCSAGVGRTGTLIALDYLMRQAEAEKEINVHKVLKHLRDARPNMVQTLLQYIFIHDALLEALQAEHTAVPCSEFSDEFRKLVEVDPETGKTILENQFGMIKSYKPELKTSDVETALSEENIHKNRDTSVLPASQYRAFLSTRVPGSTCNDYINAVYVHGYKRKKAYIATQAPLPGTVLDFWRLVYDHKARTIVMLNQFNDTNECPIYWSQGGDLEVGPLRVVCHDTQNDIPGVVTRLFRITNTKKVKSDEWEVKQFQVTDWPDGKELPSSCDVMLDLIDHVERWQQQSSNKPIIVHCQDGASRSGLFCVTCSMLEKMKVDQEVDIILAAKKVRLHRPQAITNLDQFQFCHQMALDYMEKFEEYANFK